MILVDTHVVIWLAFDPSQLSAKGRVAIEDARLKGGGLAISDITLLELATLSSKGRIGGSRPPPITSPVSRSWTNWLTPSG